MRELEPIGHHASAYSNSYSSEQNAQFQRAFSVLTQKFKEAQLAGSSTDSEEVQALVQQHYDFCLQFWKPSREAYKSLAQSYLLPSPYRDSYESVNAGLAKYHHDAIVIWADANLD